MISEPKYFKKITNSGIRNSISCIFIEINDYLNRWQKILLLRYSNDLSHHPEDIHINHIPNAFFLHLRFKGPLVLIQLHPINLVESVEKLVRSIFITQCKRSTTIYQNLIRKNNRLAILILKNFLLRILCFWALFSEIEIQNWAKM